MKPLFIFILSFLISVASKAQKTEFNIEEDLLRLDSVVTNSANYDKQKLQDINNIKLSMGGFVTPTERYNFYKRLYDEYMKFDSIMPPCVKRWQAVPICTIMRLRLYSIGHISSLLVANLSTLNVYLTLYPHQSIAYLRI